MIYFVTACEFSRQGYEKGATENEARGENNLITPPPYMEYKQRLLYNEKFPDRLCSIFGAKNNTPFICPK